MFLAFGNCEQWPLPSGEQAAVRGCTAIVLNTLDAHSGQVSLTLSNTKNMSAG